MRQFENSILGLAYLAVLASCADPNREYSPQLKHFEPEVEYTADVDMYRSPSLETYGESSLFKDLMASRTPVEGTVPRGFMPYPFPNTNEGYNLAGETLKNPLPNSPEIEAEGKELYSKFCVHCHGPEGKGDGTMVKNGKFPPPPSYTAGVSSGGGKMSELPEGKMFHSITYGRNLMGSHASQLNADERWKIIRYIQTLQKPGAAAVQHEGASKN